MEIYQNDQTDFILPIIEEYITEHFNVLIDPNYLGIIEDDILELFCPNLEDETTTKKSTKKQKQQTLTTATTCVKPLSTNDLEDHIQEALQHFFTYIMPRRSFSSSFTFKPVNVEKITEQLEYLRSIPQPVQRTEEWYKFRHNLITASELAKVFDSQAVQNSLIYSKCKPWEPMGRCNNPSSPLHWGQKYEPLSVIIYEDVYKTKVGEFGCIPHSKHSFIGASPDGINIDSTSERYGRLLEIKNVFTREIDGVPMPDYWVQMQSQMEVCNLNECDFLETKFIEYGSYREYMEDKFPQGSIANELEDIYQETTNNNEQDQDIETPFCKYRYKGCIMMFMKTDNNTPIYVFKPLYLNDDDEETIWEEDTIHQKEEEGLRWITNIYWKLQVFSCVLVLRNKFWFESALPQVREIWNTIERERVEGYTHRAPKSRTKKLPCVLLDHSPPPDINNTLFEEMENYVEPPMIEEQND